MKMLKNVYRSGKMWYVKCYFDFLEEENIKCVFWDFILVEFIYILDMCLFKIFLLSLGIDKLV